MICDASVIAVVDTAMCSFMITHFDYIIMIKLKPNMRGHAMTTRCKYYILVKLVKVA